ncbi:MAG: ACT domain-containing protein [Actinobacteria bacterium]|nr:ACT domain-containing protein [Cyanobacteriota bacterium]MCL5771354.1 ACT domain-containing protein [Actinomycetota bacterium]
MPIKQLTVFLENKLGRLAEVARILKNENINLQGFSTTEARDYGILRIVVSDPDKAREALKKAGFTTHIADVICVGVEDKPGELLQILDTLTEKKINIDYIYVIAGTRVVLSVPDIEEAEKILGEKGLRICF